MSEGKDKPIIPWWHRNGIEIAKANAKEDEKKAAQRKSTTTVQSGG